MLSFKRGRRFRGGCGHYEAIGPSFVVLLPVGFFILEWLLHDRIRVRFRPEPSPVAVRNASQPAIRPPPGGWQQLCTEAGVDLHIWWEFEMELDAELLRKQHLQSASGLTVLRRKNVCEVLSASPDAAEESSN